MEEFRRDVYKRQVAQTIWYARQGKQWALNKLNGLDLEGKKSLYRQQYIKWLPLYESDILISPFCCDKQKEEPVALYLSLIHISIKNRKNIRKIETIWYRNTGGVNLIQ